MIEARELTKRYQDGVLALDRVNFSIYPGEVYVMLGANGAGKTTTINLFLNFIEPSGGEARIDGIVCHREPLRAKRRVAYVSENVELYPNFTAVQNLDFFTRLGGRTGHTAEDYRRVLSRVGLDEGSFYKRLKDFSKGMRQKCGIAIAILKNAAAVLLDEPTSGLDPRAGHEFIELIESLREEGKAVLMSTHDIFRAKEIADVVGIMDEGKLVMQRSRRELKNEDLHALYLQYMGGREKPRAS
ncbi:MAG: ABC transporter ATP-binding protein [Candidatus Krumholzibacteriota bacterium]|nr:ABC transporter ATP-binding protein [Candidatus Krumholzibacteriota bacterium]